MQTPMPPKPPPVPTEEATTVLPIQKRKRISHSFRNKSIEKGITQKYLSLTMISVHPQKGEYPGMLLGLLPRSNIIIRCH
jgi:hypothetical protein